MVGTPEVSHLAVSVVIEGQTCELEPSANMYSFAMFTSRATSWSSERGDQATNRD